MLRIQWALMLIISLAICEGNVSAQELPTKPDFLVVASGARAKVRLAYVLNPDCSSTGAVVARVAQKPKNGEVEVVNEQGYTNYGKDDQRYKCNEKLSEIVNLYYTPNERFKGKDRFVVDVFFPNGQYRKRVFNVDVR